MNWAPVFRPKDCLSWDESDQVDMRDLAQSALQAIISVFCFVLLQTEPKVLTLSYNSNPVLGFF